MKIGYFHSHDGKNYDGRMLSLTEESITLDMVPVEQRGENGPSYRILRGDF